MHRHDDDEDTQHETAAPKEPAEMIVLRKYQLILGLLAGLLVPTVTVVAGYYHAKSEVDEKINALQLQNVQTFSKASDTKEIQDKLDQIASDVSEIKGYLSRRRDR